MRRLLDHIGVTGVAGLALLAAAVAFSSFVVQPLQAKSVLLQERLSRKAPAAQSGGDKVAAVYEYLQKAEDTTDLLAKLHGIGTATGVQLKSAAYRAQQTDARIVRYEIVLPVSGTYPHLRDFLKRSLDEIPVLSLDQLTLRRESGGSAKNSALIHAEIKLTLHLVNS